MFTDDHFFSSDFFTEEMHFLVPTTFKLILFLPLLFFFQSSTGDHVTDSCADSASYTSGSKFGSNLNELLRSLVANGPRDGFYNTTVGLEPDRVYGLVQCRGDISTDICASCLNTSSSEIVQRCPNKRAGYMRYGYDKYGYDYCLLRYSNQSFFSVLSFESFYWSFNGYNVSDAIRFNQVMKGLMGNLSNQADPAKDMFAAGEVRFTDAQNISGMVQCTGDLSKSDCRRCVQLALPTVQSCCDGLPDVQLFNPSCIMRFDVVSALQVSPPAGKKRNTLIIVLAIVISIVTALVLLFTIRGCILKRKVDKNISVGQDISKGKSLLFELQTIKVATNNFSEENIVGSGGFGIVYRGMLLNGQEIAVKRLSRGSTQGVEEFMTEVVLVAKLEHRNLVSLLGCCLEGEEKLLIYEYVPNKSLNNFLFDPVKRLQLDWQTRYKIIGGIARGLLYLHEESRLKIIHRDLKASNILLDTDMNPKISDFGMARLFGGEQTQADTSKIAGTYGYMSPEYILHGRYSAKSDVFSFGVLVLEIVAGQKSSGFYESEQAEDLLSYTWKHWREGTALELVDQSLGEDYPRSELLKCIHIGLLCVQEDAVDRPTMSSVVLILSSDSPTLQAPLPPAFFWRSIRQNALNRVPNSTFSKPMTLSENEMSITELDPH